MRWFWGLFAVSIVVMMVTVWGFGHLGWPVAVGPILWLVLGNSLRCPRCRKNIVSWFGTSETCGRCGRPNAGIWPFQFLFKPETARK